MASSCRRDHHSVQQLDVKFLAAVHQTHTLHPLKVNEHSEHLVREFTSMLNVLILLFIFSFP